MDTSSVLQKFNSLPEELKKEVADFIEFMVKKSEKLPSKKKPRQFGSAKGMFKMAPDFDEPLEDFKEYMEP